MICAWLLQRNWGVAIEPGVVGIVVEEPRVVVAEEPAVATCTHR